MHGYQSICQVRGAVSASRRGRGSQEFRPQGCALCIVVNVFSFTASPPGLFTDKRIQVVIGKWEAIPYAERLEMLRKRELKASLIITKMIILPDNHNNDNLVIVQGRRQ